MENDIFRAKKISKSTWLIRGEGCTSYLLEGEDEAVAIDTGYAEANIREFMQSLTDKPLKVCLNTHGHFDHTGGNGYFERAYMSAEALKIATIPYDSLQDKFYPLKYPITILAGGDEIEFGKRNLEVIEIPAHALSSIAFLDKENRMLFAGDEVGNVTLIWMQKEQPYVETYVQNMAKLMSRMDEFDIVLTGHGKQAYDKGILAKNLENGLRILRGEKGQSYKLDGKEAADFFLLEPEYKYKSEHKGTYIAYDIRYVKKERNGKTFEEEQ